MREINFLKFSTTHPRMINMLGLRIALTLKAGRPLLLRCVLCGALTINDALGLKDWKSSDNTRAFLRRIERNIRRKEDITYQKDLCLPCSEKERKDIVQQVIRDITTGVINVDYSGNS